MGSITIQPPVLDLSLYAGDGISFKLICKNNAEPPETIDLDGALEAEIRLDRTTEPTADPIVEFSFDLTNASIGEIILSLTGDQTQSLVEHVSVTKGKFAGVWDVQWTPVGGEPRTLVQGTVECFADVTR